MVADESYILGHKQVGNISKMPPSPYEIHESLSHILTDFKERLAMPPCYEYRESDTLSKVLWGILIAPITILITLAFIFSIEKEKDDELTRKVLEDMKTEQQYKDNVDIIHEEENVSEEEAERILRDLELD